jgi:hypothetical protein
MATAFRNIKRAREELAQLPGELFRLEKGVNSVPESLGKAITKLSEPDSGASTGDYQSSLRVTEVLLRARGGLTLLN